MKSIVVGARVGCRVESILFMTSLWCLVVGLELRISILEEQVRLCSSLTFPTITLSWFRMVSTTVASHCGHTIWLTSQSVNSLRKKPLTCWQWLSLVTLLITISKPFSRQASSLKRRQAMQALFG